MLLREILQVLNPMLQPAIGEGIFIVAKYFETNSIQEVLRLFEISFPHQNVLSCQNIVIISHLLFLI